LREGGAPLSPHVLGVPACQPARTRRAGLARTQIDRIFRIDPEPRRFWRFCRRVRL